MQFVVKHQKGDAESKETQSLISSTTKDTEAVYLNLFHVKRVCGYLPFTKTKKGCNTPVAAVIISGICKKKYILYRLVINLSNYCTTSKFA